MSQIYVLRNPEIAKRMIAQIKMLAGPAAAAGAESLRAAICCFSSSRRLVVSDSSPRIAWMRVRRASRREVLPFNASKS